MHMTWLVLSVRLALAAVFLVSGVSRLADQQGSAEAVAAFGVPTPLARVIGLGLPLVELTVAVALLPGASAPLAVVSALALLTVFVPQSVGVGGWNRVKRLRPVSTADIDGDIRTPHPRYASRRQHPPRQRLPTEYPSPYRRRSAGSALDAPPGPRRFAL